MNFIEHNVKKLWLRIVAANDASTLELAIFRVLLGVFIITIDLESFAWIGTVPDAFFDPPFLSLANLFESFPHQYIFQAIDLAYPVLILFMTLGIKTRVSALSALALLIYASTFKYSFGKIDHNILSFWTLFCLSFTNAGTKLALIPDKSISPRVQSNAMGLLALGIVFGLFTAGVEKAYIWIDFDLETGGFLSWYQSGYYTLGRTELLAPYMLNLPSVVYEGMDYIAILFELSGALWLLSGKRIWHLWLIIAGLFHTANLLILNIHFISLTFVYGAILIPTIMRQFKLSEKIARLSTNWKRGLTIIPILLYATHLLQTEPRFLLLFSDETATNGFRLTTYLILWVAFVGLSSIAYLSSLKSNPITNNTTGQKRSFD